MRQNKKDYFESLDKKSVTVTKMFWKTVAVFSNKSNVSNKITFSEKEKLIINYQKYVEELNVPADQNLLNDASIFGDTFDKTNYIPNSILPVLSKAFKRCLEVH